MRFRLLWEKESSGQHFIEDNVFEDLDLFGLFDKTIFYNYRFLMATLKQIPDVSTILYRQAIMKDFLKMDNSELETLKEYLDQLDNAFQKYQDSKLDFHQKVNFLLFIEKYLNFIEKAFTIVNSFEFYSKELSRFKNYFIDEVNSEKYALLKTDFQIAYNHFQNIQNFSLNLDSKFIVVDYMQGKTKVKDKIMDLATKLNLELVPNKDSSKKNKISDQFIVALKQLYQEDYQYLINFYQKYQNITNDFDNLSYELSYYLFFKLFFSRVQEYNIPLNPVTFNQQIINFHDVYDVTLISQAPTIVPNDVYLDLDNNIELITGVNSGGKTSYIRSIGVNYFLGLLIGFAFCQEANIIPLKSLLTHFPNDENFKIGFGRLNEELARLNNMSVHFSDQCLLILNETFSSTDEITAFNHTKTLLDKLLTNDTFCLFVTHQQKIFDYELPSRVNVLSPMIDKNNHNKRLYKLMKVTDKTSSYTYDILYKYGLTKEQLTKRLEEKND